MIERTCKYNHGPLHKEPGVWSLKGEGSTPFPNFPGVLMSDLAFSLTIFRCAVCGYLEFVDAPGNFDPNGNPESDR